MKGSKSLENKSQQAQNPSPGGLEGPAIPQIPLESILGDKTVPVQAKEASEPSSLASEAIPTKILSLNKTWKDPEALATGNDATKRQQTSVNNATEYTLDWSILNFNQSITSRQNSFMTLKSNEKKVGINILANHLSILNGKIPFEWLNCSLPSYKMHCKKFLL